MLFPKIILRTFLPIALLLALPMCLHAADLEIMYLANEGVMIQCGNEKVLVDALLRDSIDDYARHSPDVQEKLETGKPPFDGVQLALATHFHLDHWDPGSITRFLLNNPTAMFASTRDGTAMMAWSQRKRIWSLWPVSGRNQSIQRDGINVTAFSLNHGKAQNLGYRISMCGKSVFHLGDADGSPADQAALMRMGRADIAVVPFWWLLDPQTAPFVRKRWKPRHIVAVHFAAHEEPEAQQVRSRWPEAWVCRNQGESRAF
jgi:L-ascorbate metabolism protein UlaG (beta-lactamase superfamily)